jgi:hypothetical protein
MIIQLDLFSKVFTKNGCAMNFTLNNIQLASSEIYLLYLLMDFDFLILVFFV